jgi:transposase
MRLVTDNGYGVGATARHLGIHANRLSRWNREAETTQHAAFPGNGRVSPAQDEGHRLRHEHKRLRRERDVVNKALGDFASESSGDRP